MPWVDLEFIVHMLNVDPLFPPKKQKSRRSAKEHVEVVKQEVKRLKEVRAIKEVFFPRMACEYHGGEKEEMEMESLCRFY